MDRARAVVFLPISPVEAHGPHLPLGTDIYVARALCERMAGELERRQPDLRCLLAPPVTIGSDLVPMAGSLSVRWRTVHTVAMRAGGALARDGFRTVVLASGHGGLSHVVALELAAFRLRARYGAGMLAATAALGRTVLRSEEVGRSCAQLDRPLSEEGLRAIARLEHGGLLETSVMLAVRPDLVRPAYRSLPPQPPRPYLGRRHWLPPGFQGYVGEPADARADVGELITGALAAGGADMVEHALALAAGSAGADRHSRMRRLALVGLGAVSAFGLAGAAAVSMARRRAE
jgi:creatinine amidohydrolase